MYPLALALILLLPVAALAGDLQFLACGHVHFFRDACAPVLPPEEETAAARDQGAAEAPLFPPETLAKDTPPLLVELLTHPTPEAADAYLDWQRRRADRVQEAMALLKARQAR